MTTPRPQSALDVGLDAVSLVVELTMLGLVLALTKLSSVIHS